MLLYSPRDSRLYYCNRYQDIKTYQVTRVHANGLLLLLQKHYPLVEALGVGPSNRGQGHPCVASDAHPGLGTYVRSLIFHCGASLLVKADC